MVTIFRDPRGYVLERLRDLGIDAHLMDRGHTLEDVGIGWFWGSLGLIDISHGPISWVHVRWANKPGSVGDREYFTDYGVPDTRLKPGSVKPKVKSVRMKSYPLIGRVTDLHWKGQDFGLGIIDRLNNDMSIKQPMMNSNDVKIRAFRLDSCWIISTKINDDPSEEQWNCYQSIAQHLLAEWS